MTKALRPSRREGLPSPACAPPGKNLPAGELAPLEECGAQREDPRRTRNSCVCIAGSANAPPKFGTLRATCPGSPLGHIPLQEALYMATKKKMTKGKKLPSIKTPGHPHLNTIG